MCLKIPDTSPIYIIECYLKCTNIIVNNVVRFVFDENLFNLFKFYENQ